MPTVCRLLLPACFLAISCAPVYAQSESVLRDFFEGKSVVVRLDMPATQEGIDVFPDARRAIDFAVYSARVKATGVAIRNGESVMVTKIRVKDKLIEFQLAGGGYGTFGDDTGSVYTPSVSKSNREKDLERLVKSETDAARRRQLQRELDDLRNERAAEYVEFPFATDRRPAPQGSRVTAQPVLPEPGFSGGAIRKGMTLAEVEDALGKAEKTTNRAEGTLRVTTATYSRGDQLITAEFVEGVLIKYSISSK